ncbi:MAG: lipopolysaccharide heptosyltransferase II [Verrucomicrobiota bacterium]|nr:lipopolysaccharide heptosyltransferase II [Verrucomicrobiota bacterium]
MKILIVKPSSLGDIIHAFPAINFLRKHYPNAYISWVVNKEYVEVVELCSTVDQTIIFDRKNWKNLKFIKEFFSLIKELREDNYDLVFDFQGLFRSGCITGLSGASKKIGFQDAREFASIFYTDKEPIPANIKNAIRKNIFLVQNYLRQPDAEIEFPKIKKLQENSTSANKLLKNAKINTKKHNIIAVAPETRWESKTWPAKKFADLLDVVAQKNDKIKFWIIGTESGKNIGEKIISKCLYAKPVSFMGQTPLGTLVELLRESKAIITNDSGPMHIACALQIPVFAFFGPTSQELTGPIGTQHTVFSNHEAECAPCFQKKCSKKYAICNEIGTSEQLATQILEKLNL